MPPLIWSIILDDAPSNLSLSFFLVVQAQDMSRQLVRRTKEILPHFGCLALLSALTAYDYYTTRPFLLAQCSATLRPN